MDPTPLESELYRVGELEQALVGVYRHPSRARKRVIDATTSDDDLMKGPVDARIQRIRSQVWRRLGDDRRHSPTDKLLNLLSAGFTVRGARGGSDPLKLQSPVDRVV